MRTARGEDARHGGCNLLGGCVVMIPVGRWGAGGITGLFVCLTRIHK